MLNSKQRRSLKYLAHSNELIKYQVGKDYINDNQIEMLSKALLAHEMIKIKFLKSCEVEAKDAVVELTRLLNCDCVQCIGHTCILFKENKENRIFSSKI